MHIVVVNLTIADSNGDIWGCELKFIGGDFSPELYPEAVCTESYVAVSIKNLFTNSLIIENIECLEDSRNVVEYVVSSEVFKVYEKFLDCFYSIAQESFPEKSDSWSWLWIKFEMDVARWAEGTVEPGRYGPWYYKIEAWSFVETLMSIQTSPHSFARVQTVLVKIGKSDLTQRTVVYTDNAIAK